MLIGGRTQVGADAFADPGQDVGAGPSQAPGQEGGRQQAAQVQADLAVVDGQTVLERDQHVVHQRHGQVRRHQGSGRAQQRQDEAGQQRTAVRAGEAPQAQERPGGRRRRLLLVAGGAFFLVRRNTVFTVGAGTFGARLFLMAGQADRLLPFELGQEAQGGRIACQRETPDRQAGGIVVQLQHGGAGVVAQVQR
ncbi:hypothetical protein G6F31_018368 [Rhizopus arrhizus]|nr:hypothetical protein G6F31_018368 [Rhizopus arrhizus]